MKIAAGIIVFNSDFVLKQVLESIYPYVNQILVSEGCVGFWKKQGYTTSTDKTNEILKNFPDPEHKIIIVHGTYSEKTEQANAYIPYIDADTDYIWNIDGDEIFKAEDIKRIIQKLETGRYTSVGFKSCTFYGGFDNKLTGFEEESEFLRIQKYYPSARWANHRPPTIEAPAGVQPWPKNHLSFNELAAEGIFMYHYSYVFPRQVKEKVFYYENAVISPGKCIPNYFESVYLTWVNGTNDQRKEVEQKYRGVHEFMPVTARGDCYTEPFTGTHPQSILDAMDDLKEKFDKQLSPYL